jgi:hypothetical protein
LSPAEDSQDLSNPEAAWVLLQQRVDRLLETVTALRKANAEIMKENVILTGQARQGGALKEVSQGEFDRLKRRHDEALADLSRIREYIRKVEALMAQSGRSLPPM